MTKWVFAKLDPAAVRRDPNETQLFKSEQAEYAGTDALVREILQNSIDAGTGKCIRSRLKGNKPNAGNLRHRLPVRISRLEKTYDLMSLTAAHFMELLGNEFSFARSKTPTLFDDAIH